MREKPDRIEEKREGGGRKEGSERDSTFASEQSVLSVWFVVRDDDERKCYYDGRSAD